MIPRKVQIELPPPIAESLGAVQFFRRATVEEEKKLNALHSHHGLHGGKRWTSPQRPDAACCCHTKSEAIAWFKRLLGVKKLPQGFEIRAF